MKYMFLFLCLAGMSGCIDYSIAESQFSESEFSKLHRGDYTGNGAFTKKQTKVITNQPDYNEELLNYTDPKPDNIDFTKGKVLLVDMGQRNTGGYSIAVTSIDVNKAHVTANVVLVKPGASCMVAQTLTNPYQFVFVPTLKEILVTETLSVTECVE